jgi:hypothetical protein
MSHYTGAWCYMRDDGLDMALKVLFHNISAPAHGIAICTSVDSQVCMDPSLGGKEDYPTRFGQCNWIFMPINDGMAEQMRPESEEHATEQVQGSHWALVAIDRIHKVIHYMDGMNKHDERWLALAHHVASNMLHAIGEVPCPAWRIVEELYAPHQWIHNSFGTHDEGPCAPYVYHLIGTLAARIIAYRDAGAEAYCELVPDPQFQAQFQTHFDSYHVRNNMQRSIWEWKEMLEADDLALAHDREATRDVTADIVDPPLDASEVPRVRGRPAERSSTGSECSSLSRGSDDITDEQPALERADEPGEDELGTDRFDCRDKFLETRCHASIPSVNVTMAEEDNTSEDEV